MAWMVYSDKEQIVQGVFCFFYSKTAFKKKKKTKEIANTV